MIVILGAVGPGGVAVRMTYDPQLGSGVAFGCWTSEIGQLDEDVPIPWPISITTYDRRPGKAGYSVCVNIDAPADVAMRVETAKRGAT